MTWIEWVRWVHVVAGVAWLGEVMTVAFVLAPALAAAAPADRLALLERVFPRVFHLATALVLTAGVSGATLFLFYFGSQPMAAVTTGRGLGLLVGGLLAGALGAFHLFMEPRLERRIGSIAALHDGASAAPLQAVVGRLQIIPRVGLGVLVIVTLLMVASARGALRFD